jgi:hypothetical protein
MYAREGNDDLDQRFDSRETRRNDRSRLFIAFG